MEKATAHSYQNLEVWKRSIDLVESVYKMCGQLPQYEKYGLADQMRRAAVSIPSNIAEGQKRMSDKDTIQFCGIALGSLAELETQLIITSRVHSIGVKNLLDQCAVISRMLHALIRALRAKK